MSEQRAVVLDVDVGIDDALMILGLVSEPAVEVVAIGATHGNCTAANSARNALRTLEAVGITSVPVALGRESPLAEPTSAPQVHGHDGLGDIGLPEPAGSVTGESAADQLIRLSSERPDELDLITVGSLSNLAAALEKDPESLKRYRSVTYLGCLSRYPEPIVPDYNDANVYFDPNASRAVLSSDTPMTIVPIDLSRRAALEDRHLDALKNGQTPQARFAWTILPYYCNFYQERLGRWSASMHDPLAATIAIDPSLATEVVERPIVVEPYGDRHRAVGRTEPSADTAGIPAKRIVPQADLPRFLDRFVDSLLGPINPVYQSGN
ncbi:MAG: nucleoside hydrolase [Thermomicrobiales bacterium]|nr:nucleoside hydrolase [Thermomicrobiales bacterium]MCO5222157.1 nucleoside hydrolase [Thermomicrobiales bacterium]